MENTGMDMGHQQRRIFPYESRADDDGARLSLLRVHLGVGVPRYYGCTRCMDDTMSQQLTSTKDGGSGKIMYMGHRRWLEKDDPWRKRGDLLNGLAELRGPPRKRSGTKIDELLRNWEQCPMLGKSKRHRSRC